jgi:hypothetical protein
MALTLLDSLMIENPAFFQALSSVNQFNTNNIITVGLSVQRLSADIGTFNELNFEQSAFKVTNAVYVAKDGKDTNTGRSIFDPVRTIKKACEIAHNALYSGPGNRPDFTKKYTIFVGTGEFYEDNPIYVPPNTSIIGDNLRRSSVYPNFPMYDLFWCTTSVYIWGFTFRGHHEGGAATAFPDFTSSRTLTSIGLRNLTTPGWFVGSTPEWRAPYIVTSPYIQGSSSITRMLTANRFQLTAQQNYSVSQTWNANVSAFKEDVGRLFDDITHVMVKGPGSSPARGFAPRVGAQSWSNAIQNNTPFIQKETIGFINALSAASPIDSPWRTFSYDQSKCERDISYILSAVRADMIAGNNTQSLFNAAFYHQGNNLVIPSNQLAATVTAIEFVKKLAFNITDNPVAPAPPLYTGTGMRVDGTKAEGFLRSFVLDSYTQFNEGGRGIHILNNGYAQLVSIFTICCTEGLLAESGGQMSVNNSNCSFGLSGIVAKGKSLTPVLTGRLVNNILDEPQPDQIFIDRVDGTIQVPNSKYTVEGSTIGVDTRKLVTSPYNGMVFTLGNDPTLYAIRDQPALITEAIPERGITPSTPTDRKFQLAATTFILGVPFSGGQPATGTDGQPVTTAAYLSGSYVQFYLRSTITTSSHTMEYIGSGFLLEQSVPGLGGRAKVENEAVTVNGGATYFTTTDQVGNFRVGTGFTIVQETGLIEGDTFKRAMLALITPLILALE